MISWDEMKIANDAMIMVEIKPLPEVVLGEQFANETWQEIFNHCLDHDPQGLPWCKGA